MTIIFWIWLIGFVLFVVPFIDQSRMGRYGKNPIKWVDITFGCFLALFWFVVLPWRLIIKIMN